MARQVLLLVAMPEEFAASPAPDWVLVHTGVGKVNAAWRTAQALAQHRPDLVVNFGTAGAVVPALSGLIEVGTAVQRDMDVRALGLALGETPFETGSPEIRFSPAPWVCGTGDSFAASAPELPCDIVDMELYAIAKVCRAAGVPLRAFKFISDNADGAAPSDWRTALRHAEAAFAARVSSGIYAAADTARA
jgi:adenosylhomocysteine nucleosidase